MGRTRVSFTKGKSPTPLARAGKHQPSNKILIIVPFWDGDRWMANTLLRFLADLEPTHSDKADILMLARFDTDADGPTVEAVSKKFNVYSYVSKKRMVGWPAGCNSVAFSAFEWAYSQISSGRIPGYKALFMMGPDTCPLQKGWIDFLHRTWDSMNKDKNVYVAGHLLFAGNRMHINGDACLLSGRLDFLKWLNTEANSMRPLAGWDYFLAPQFEQWGWEHIPAVRSIWDRRVPFTDYPDWYNETAIGTVIFHGQKDLSLLTLARQKLLT